jgi:hypothetical protein
MLDLFDSETSIINDYDKDKDDGCQDTCLGPLPPVTAWGVY